MAMENAAQGHTTLDEEEAIFPSIEELNPVHPRWNMRMAPITSKNGGNEVPIRHRLAWST
jgi:hypothetical protein